MQKYSQSSISSQPFGRSNYTQTRATSLFHSDDKLYQQKCLTMGFKSAQGKLNIVLEPIFAHIPKAHLIHGDLVIAMLDMVEHIQVLTEVMIAISRAGLTLNPKKCVFGKDEIEFGEIEFGEIEFGEIEFGEIEFGEIEFGGMIIGALGVKPDPEKVVALEHLQPPKSKDELISFLCMLQSNAEFIKDFSKNRRSSES